MIVVSSLWTGVMINLRSKWYDFRPMVCKLGELEMKAIILSAIMHEINFNLALCYPSLCLTISANSLAEIGFFIKQISFKDGYFSIIAS